MKKMHGQLYATLTAGVLLLAAGPLHAQRRLPIGGTTVPPDGSSASQLPSADTSRSGENTQPATLSPTQESDNTTRRNFEAIRANMANTERQKLLTREASQLLQMVAELHLKLTNNTAGVSQEEMLRQVDVIEKLARDVKERMKGGR